MLVDLIFGERDSPDGFRGVGPACVRTSVRILPDLETRLAYFDVGLVVGVRGVVWDLAEASSSGSHVFGIVGMLE